MFKHILAMFHGSPIRLQRVDLGDAMIELPLADLVGQRPGSTLLVTAGVDGDEYAGMTAAYQLIERYKTLDFAGRLIVVPLVNIPGFQAECSHNPADNKFPKYVFPGRVNGSSTERLMNFIASLAVEADCWYDLHGAAITEGVNPYLWLHNTRVAKVDTLARDIIHYGVAPIIMYESARFGLKSDALAKQSCTYIVAESGSRRTSLVDDVTRHLTWLEQTMQLLSMIEGTPERKETQVLTRVSYITATFDGLWQPALVDYSHVAQGTTLGVATKLDGTGKKIIRATSSGTPLWWKETMRLKRGDILMALGL